MAPADDLGEAEKLSWRTFRKQILPLSKFCELSETAARSQRKFCELFGTAGRSQRKFCDLSGSWKPRNESFATF
jgi:hypothetical protein